MRLPDMADVILELYMDDLARGADTWSLTVAFSIKLCLRHVSLSLFMIFRWLSALSNDEALLFFMGQHAE